MSSEIHSSRWSATELFVTKTKPLGLHGTAVMASIEEAISGNSKLIIKKIIRSAHANCDVCEIYARYIQL